VFKVGDLARYTSTFPGPNESVVIIERDIQSDEGNWWWRIFVPSIGRKRIVGEWELEVFDEQT
tara:strand:- start:212 stop:400 length:189 start_codon:yes stop_codon:yes gene_type:complete